MTGRSISTPDTATPRLGAETSARSFALRGSMLLALGFAVTAFVLLDTPGTNATAGHTATAAAAMPSAPPAALGIDAEDATVSLAVRSWAWETAPRTPPARSVSAYDTLELWYPNTD